MSRESQAAHSLARGTASRYSQRSASADDEAGRLDRYLSDLARGIHRRGWHIDAQPATCAFCGKRGGLRTGVLPHVGPLLYCRRCADSYHILRGEIDPAQEERKTHLVGPDGAPRCGIGVLTTTEPRAVTCLRCQLYLKEISSPSLLDRLLRYL